MASPDDAKILITGPSPRGWHRLQLAAECLQKYAWKYETPQSVQSEKTTSLALIKGTLTHLALAQHYARIRDGENGWVEPVEAVQLVAAAENYALDTRVMAEVIDTYQAYARHYAVEDLKYKVLHVEELQDIQIASKYRLTGRLDLTVEDLAGRIWVFDHKCQPASSKVLTPEGPKTVGMLLEDGTDWTCCAWDEKARQTVWTTALAPIDAGEQDVYDIALGDGTSERYGYRHPLLTDAGWKQAADIEIGDWVAVAPPPDLPEADIPDAILRVCGLALSDGGRLLDDSGSYCITAHDERVRAFVIEALDELGDTWATHTLHGEPVGVRLRVQGRARVYLDTMGITKELAVDKTFPADLLALSRRQAGVLLGALWEGDGAAYLGTPDRSGHRPVRLVFSSRSRSMVEGVRHLLLQLGILANITESTAASAPYFQAVIVGRDNKRRFIESVLTGEIDCPVTRAGGKMTRRGRVLGPIGELLMALEQSEPRGADQRVRVPTQGRFKNPRIEHGVRWVRVEQKTYCGKERCYDIEVPGQHTFLTGHCAVTHNTTGRITSAHKQFYSVSGQLLGYSHMARQKFGVRYAGLIVNLIQVGPEPKFERIVLPRSPQLESRFEQIVVDIEQSIERVQAEGRDVADWPKAINEMTCYSRYGACNHIDWCRHGQGASKAGNWKFQR